MVGKVLAVFVVSFTALEAGVIFKKIFWNEYCRDTKFLEELKFGAGNEECKMEIYETQDRNAIMRVFASTVLGHYYCVGICTFGGREKAIISCDNRAPNHEDAMGVCNQPMIDECNKVVKEERQQPGEASVENFDCTRLWTDDAKEAFLHDTADVPKGKVPDVQIVVIPSSVWDDDTRADLLNDMRNKGHKPIFDEES